MTSRCALVALAAWQADVASACTVAAVGADASSTGHPLVAHTDDSGADTTDVRFNRVPRKQWPKGSKRPLYNWADGYPRVVSSVLSPEYAPVSGQRESAPVGEIDQVPETYAYWDMDYGVQNEMGLSMGESTCTAKTAGWPATPDKPWGYCRAGIEDLSKIGLERCATARCAVQTMGAIAVEMGFYSADSGDPAAPDHADSAEALAVADIKELWIFNVMTGKNNASALWAAERIPAGNVAAIGNTFTIRKMNLNDPENFLYSPGVTQLAEENGWWSPEDDEPGWFDWFGSYGYQPAVSGPDPKKAWISKETLSYYSGRRMWRIFSLLSPVEGAKLDGNKGNLPKTVNPYPGSVPAPKGSVTPAMVMEVLRDHYEGTPYDLTAGMAAGPFGNPNRGPVQPLGALGVWERAISMHRSSWSYVLEARPQGRSVSWIGLGSPHGTAYLPFFGASATGAPDSFHSHDGFQSKFSTNVAYWAFAMINEQSEKNFQLINQEVRGNALNIENEAREKLAECNAAADRAEAHGGEAAAQHVLAECANDFALAKVAQWWELGWSFFGKYDRYGITQNESANGQAPQRYPQWWIDSQEVGFTLWSPQGPFHGQAIEAVLPVGFAAMNSAGLASPVGFLLSAMALVGTYQFGVKRGRQLSQARDDAAYFAAP